MAKRIYRNVLESAEVNHINVLLRNAKVTPVEHVAMLLRILGVTVADFAQDDTTAEQDNALRDAVGCLVESADHLLKVQEGWNAEGKSEGPADTVPPPAPNAHVVKEAAKVGNGLLDALAGKS